MHQLLHIFCWVITVCCLFAGGFFVWMAASGMGRFGDCVGLAAAFGVCGWVAAWLADVTEGA